MGFVYPTDEWFLVAGRILPSLDWYDGLAAFTSVFWPRYRQ